MIILYKEIELRKLSKKLDYRFELYYTNNFVDKKKYYWNIIIYPYIMGYPEIEMKSRHLESLLKKALIWLKKGEIKK